MQFKKTHHHQNAILEHSAALKFNLRKLVRIKMQFKNAHQYKNAILEHM